MSQTKHRALLAMDAGNIVRILATDSGFIAFDVDEISSDAVEIGVVEKDVGPGLWLWEGTVEVVDTGYWDQPVEHVPEYTGSVRAVWDREEIDALFAMTPPEPPPDPDEDRDSPGT